MHNSTSILTTRCCQSPLFFPFSATRQQDVVIRWLADRYGDVLLIRRRRVSIVRHDHREGERARCVGCPGEFAGCGIDGRAVGSAHQAEGQVVAVGVGGVGGKRDRVLLVSTSYAE